MRHHTCLVSTCVRISQLSLFHAQMPRWTKLLNAVRSWPAVLHSSGTPYHDGTYCAEDGMIPYVDLRVGLLE